MRPCVLAALVTFSSWALSSAESVETAQQPAVALANATALPPDIADVESVDASTAATEEVAGTMTDTVAETGRPGVGSGEGAGESGSEGGSGASGGGSTSAGAEDGKSSTSKTRKTLGTATAPLLLTGLGAAACCGIFPGSRRLRNAKRRDADERRYYSMGAHDRAPGAPQRQWHEPV